MLFGRKNNKTVNKISKTCSICKKNMKIRICSFRIDNQVKLVIKMAFLNLLTLKDAGGDQKCPLDTDKACIPSIFIKTSQKNFWCPLTSILIFKISCQFDEDYKNRP